MGWVGGWWAGEGSLQMGGGSGGCCDRAAKPPPIVRLPGTHLPLFAQRLIDHFGLKPEGELTLLIDDPKGPAKYLKAGLKPSDIPEFIREFQARQLTDSALRWQLSWRPGGWHAGVVVCLLECRLDVACLPAPVPACLPACLGLFMCCRRAPLRSG